jgi:hypothetical protein
MYSIGCIDKMAMPRRPRTTLRLPSVPNVVFPPGLQHLSALTRSMLESDQFDYAMNKTAKQLRKRFLDAAVPTYVHVVSVKKLDRKPRHFALYDPAVGYQGDKDQHVIQLSFTLSECVRLHANNAVLKVVACICVVHEVSHILLRYALRMATETPDWFKNNHGVDDLGYYIEKKMFRDLRLGSTGVEMLHNGRQCWFTLKGNYDNAVIGNKPSRRQLTGAYVTQLARRNKWVPPASKDVIVNRGIEKMNHIGRGQFASSLTNLRGTCGIE